MSLSRSGHLVSAPTLTSNRLELCTTTQTMRPHLYPHFFHAPPRFGHLLLRSASTPTFVHRTTCARQPSVCTFFSITRTNISNLKPEPPHHGKLMRQTCNRKLPAMLIASPPLRLIPPPPLRPARDFHPGTRLHHPLVLLPLPPPPPQQLP